MLSFDHPLVHPRSCFNLFVHSHPPLSPLLVLSFCSIVLTQRLSPICVVHFWYVVSVCCSPARAIAVVYTRPLHVVFSFYLYLLPFSVLCCLVSSSPFVCFFALYFILCFCTYPSPPHFYTISLPVALPILSLTP